MAVSKRTAMKLKSVQNQAELVKSYLLSDPYISYTSVLSGVFASKMVSSSPTVSIFFLSGLPWDG